MKFLKKILFLFSIMILSSCLQAQKSDPPVESIGDIERILDSPNSETFFGVEIPFNPDLHMDMLQLLFRMNWYDNESVYIPQLSNSTLELRRSYYADFQNKIMRVYENPESRKDRISTVSFDSTGLISQYTVEIMPQEDLGSTALAVIQVIDVDYSNLFVRRRLNQEDGVEYDDTFPIRVFESAQ